MQRLGPIAVFILFTGVPAPGQAPAAATQVLAEASPLVEGLPDSPGTTQSASDPEAWPTGYSSSAAESGLDPAGPSCTLSDSPAPADTEAGLAAPLAAPLGAALAAPVAAPRSSCLMPQNPFRPYVTPPVKRLTARGKLHLAIFDLTNPGNLATVAGNAVYTVATGAHGPYGPGFNGFRRNVQVSLTGEASFELIGTFGVCTLARQDPRYFRMPHASPMRRVLHAVAHVAIAQSDSGRRMPNVENLVTSYATAELANLYVPGIDSSAASTNERILTGLATEPIGNLIAEFLPDIASHVHVHLLVMQRFLNQISTGQQMN